MRYIGLDLGTKTLGIATSDLTGTIASSLTTLRFEENNPSMILNDLRKIIEDYKAEVLVLGLPKNMNNSLGDAAQRSLDFKKILEDEFDLKVELQDERLSSVTANNILISADISRNKRKKKVDGMAAEIILQSYLDKLGKGN